MNYKKRHLTYFLLILTCTLVSNAEIFLPGMQPEESNIEFAKVKQCRMCHANTKNRDADPYFSWQSSMMAHAVRDPLYRAALTIANQDIEGVGEFCWRCHAPRGWLEGRSSPADGSALNQEDKQGVSCDICHKLIDPLSNEAAKLIKDLPPSHGNAMMVADPENTVRGPYEETKGAMPHQTKQSDFHASSNLCGVCHNISNPIFAKDVKTEPVHSFGHIERTYSEWLLSDFAKQGKEGTCQSCHYEKVPGGGQASRFGSIHRDYFVKHGPIGGSSWIQDVIWMLGDQDELDRKALDMGKERAVELLRTAAKLEFSKVNKETAKLKVINLTGHKLPSGYPEGRRMWVNLKFYDNQQHLIKEVGRYGQKQDLLFQESIAVETLLDEDKATVYEIKPGMSKTQAQKYDKKAGPSFHFVLNDIISKDNRIPPKGFNNKAFAEHLSAPVGKTYNDGQYWDDIEFEIPSGCVKIQARLMYQSVSWEYIKFLAEENKTDQWGKRLYEAWDKTGKCRPVTMADISMEIE